MTYITGDIHGQTSGITRFCHRMNLTAEDTLIILGDVGANYYGPPEDDKVKKRLASLAPTILCIHGNHEMRPATVPGYQETTWHGGKVWFEPKYPNLLFAKDGEIFDIEGVRYLVIGGAYSVDKFYRIVRHYGWWPDEQPSEEIKVAVEKRVEAGGFDAILSHTCPYKYIPREMFLPMIDQSTVDDSTERWLDTIEEKANYHAWFCGHWHTDKRVDKMHFLYNTFEDTEDLLISAVSKRILERNKAVYTALEKGPDD